MKKYIRLICVLLSVAAFTACEDEDRGLVVSQDTSYQLDPDYVYVDIPKEFQFDATNILYLDGKTVLNLNAKTDGTTTNIIEGTEFTFNIRIKKALSNDLTVRLVQDEELLNEYNAGGAVLFPEETVAVSEVVIPAGQTSVPVTLTFQNLDKLTDLKGYILPLRLQVGQTTEEVKVSIQKYSVFVQMALEFGKDNVDTSSFQAFDGEQFNDVITFESDTRTSGLRYLNDGNLSGSTWYGYKDNWLTMTMPEAQVIKGMRLVVNNNYLLGHIKISVDEGSGYINYGTFDFNERSNVYIKFKQPVAVKAIKLEEFYCVGMKNNGPELYEVLFIR